MSGWSEEKIRQEEEALLKGEPRSWVQISEFLNAARDSWRRQPRTRSFSDWLDGLCKKTGRKRASFWRFLSAGQKYNHMRSKAMNLRPGWELPELGALGEEVSPESIELLEKLFRVLDEGEAMELLKGLVEGKVVREELRARWQAFRPALDGKTARGRNTSFTDIKVDRKDARQLRKVRHGEVETALREQAREWLDCPEPRFLKVLRDVPPLVGHDDDLRIDLVVLVQREERGSLEVHGVEIMPEGLCVGDTKFYSGRTLFDRGNEDSGANPAAMEKALWRIMALMDYCEVFWVAGHHADFLQYEAIPDRAGVLMLDESGQVMVFREGKKLPVGFHLVPMLKSICLRM